MIALPSIAALERLHLNRSLFPARTKDGLTHLTPRPLFFAVAVISMEERSSAPSR